jgi:hypothetical protein
MHCYSVYFRGHQLVMRFRKVTLQRKLTRVLPDRGWWSRGKINRQLSTSFMAYCYLADQKNTVLFLVQSAFYGYSNYFPVDSYLMYFSFSGVVVRQLIFVWAAFHRVSSYSTCRITWYSFQEKRFGFGPCAVNSGCTIANLKGIGSSSESLSLLTTISGYHH